MRSAMWKVQWATTPEMSVRWSTKKAQLGDAPLVVFLANAMREPNGRAFEKI